MTKETLSINYERNMTKRYHAPKEIQIQELKRSIEKGLTYQLLSSSVNRLVKYNFITRSQANKYKSWYRKIVRGEL